MRRLIVTIMALPAMEARRFSQCATMSAAMASSRESAPTKASRRDHLDFACSDSLAPLASLFSSTMASSCPSWSSSRLIFARRDS